MSPAFTLMKAMKKEQLPARQVVCPACKGPSVYAPSNPSRPFCSERCKNVDLGAWANEDFRLPAETPPDDQPYGDPKLH